MSIDFFILSTFYYRIMSQKYPRFFNFFLFPRRATVSPSSFPHADVRGRSAGYVTTIHLFSDNTINQNKLGWERENRLPAPREAIPARPASSSSFVAACACRVHLEHKRTQARRVYPGIRMQRDNARICVPVRVCLQ